MRAAIFSIVIAYLVVFFCIWIEYSRENIVFIQGDVKPFDVATLALVAATLVVTCLGVIAAIAAIWGFEEIKKAAVGEAVKAAIARAEDTAEVVATRVAKEVQPFETTTDAADDIVQAFINMKGGKNDTE